MEERAVQFIGQACETEGFAEKYCDFSRHKLGVSLLDSSKVSLMQKGRMKKMLKSKVIIAAGSVIGAFIIIYGTAILFQLLFGAYLFEGGLTNFNYGLLALLCAVPFAVIAVVGKNTREAKEAVIISSVLFSVLFMLVHLVLVLSAEVMDAAAVIRILVTFPVSALFLAGILYFTAGKERAV